MADLQPFEAIRFAPNIDPARVICPPFDTISSEQQSRLYDADPHNAVRLELPRDPDPYRAAAATLRDWLTSGALVRDNVPAFYVHQQRFDHSGRTHDRRVLFGRLRLEPWNARVVLPHERTFAAPKEDRLNLLQALRLNTSPIFLMYPDPHQHVAPLVANATNLPPVVQFVDGDGSEHALWRLTDAGQIAAISRAFQDQRLYVADGHHRYETALAFSRAEGGDADAPHRFVLAALTAADDPGLLVLPIHRLARADLPLERTLDRLTPLFEVETRPSLESLVSDIEDRGRMINTFGLAAAGSPDFYLLTLYQPDAAAQYLPADRSPEWQRLDASIANHVILRHGLGLEQSEMEDIHTVWYEEDARRAVDEVRDGRARYALLLNAVSPRRTISIADGGEPMPQKSTFFYPKIPTGLLFNPLFGR